MTSWNIVLRNDIKQLECAKATLLFCTNLHYNYEPEADWRTDYPVPWLEGGPPCVACVMHRLDRPAHCVLLVGGRTACVAYVMHRAVRPAHNFAV